MLYKTPSFGKRCVSVSRIRHSIAMPAMRRID